MAQFELKIIADNDYDYRNALLTLAAPYLLDTTKKTLPSAQYHEGLNDEEPDAGATQDAEPGERQRRTRRTKAQIEADNAAGTSAAQGQATDQMKGTTQPASPSLTTTRTSSDVFGDQLKEVTSGALSLADVEKVGREAFEKIGAPAMQAILMDKANGAKSFKQVEPQFFEAVHAALVEAAGE